MGLRTPPSLASLETLQPYRIMTDKRGIRHAVDLFTGRFVRLLKNIFG
jgi:hypothetical protein